MNKSRKFFKALVMAKPKFESTRRGQPQRRSGMTLIELLVAVSILVIIAAILVPQLRFASADRNIREASRLVASLFAEASQRAINEGVSGVVIERNPNITDDTGAYAGTSMFVLRTVPPYVGNEAVDRAEYVQGPVQVEGPDESLAVPFPDVPPGLVEFDPNAPENPFDIWIPAPFEDGIVQVGDQISFNSQPLRLNILAVAEEEHVADGSIVLRLRLAGRDGFVAGDVPTQLTEGGNGNTRATIGTFIVHRQPRKLVSSRIDMPTGYLVDLRLSGELDTPTRSVFSIDNRVVLPAGDLPNSVALLFNGRGAVDRYVYTGFAGTVPTRQFVFPTQPVYLMVREYNPDDGGEMVENVLGSENQMWVTVDPTTGAANVISGVGVDTSVFTTLPETLAEARKLGSQGQAAQ